MPSSAENQWTHNVERASRRGQRGQIIGWQAKFEVTAPPDYYIDLYAAWPEVCGGPRHFLYTFQVSAV